MALDIVTLEVVPATARSLYGNASAQYLDSQKKVFGGAALDVYILTTHWNSDRLDVIWGYSSRLHALNNIPVRQTDLLWSLG